MARSYLKPLDDCEPRKDEGASEDDGGDEAPTEHSGLGGGRRLKVIENEREHEQIVDRERLLQHVRRQPRGGVCGPSRQKNAHAECDRRRDGDARLLQRLQAGREA